MFHMIQRFISISVKYEMCIKYIYLLLYDYLMKIIMNSSNFIQYDVKCFQALDLLDKLLTLDPSKRVDSSSALDHDFFWTDPMPGDLSKMLSQHTQVLALFRFSRYFFTIMNFQFRV